MARTPGTYAVYLVALIWDDGTRTTLVVKAKDREYAIRAVEDYAYGQWAGHIEKTLCEPLTIPEEPYEVAHLFTEN